MIVEGIAKAIGWFVIAYVIIRVLTDLIMFYRRK